jgi:hypothetical protein
MEGTRMNDAAAPSPSATADEAKAPPKFVGGPPRLRSVPLVYPVEYDGVIYNEIVVVRLAVADIAAFQEAAAKLPEGQVPPWPAFRDADGKPMPIEVLGALDDDDQFELDKVTRNFLPRRYRAVPESDSAQSAGGSTASP